MTGTFDVGNCDDARAKRIQGSGVRQASIEVALATFNSARFLPELLDSLFGQTCQGFTILVSDARSTDSTLDIIADYQRRYPGRITMLEPDTLRASARKLELDVRSAVVDIAVPDTDPIPASPDGSLHP